MFSSTDMKGEDRTSDTSHLDEKAHHRLPPSESCNRPSSGSTGVRTELLNLDTGDLVLIWTHAENYTSALQCFFNKDCSSSKSCKRPGSGSTLPDMVTIIITINCIRQYKVPKRLKMASSTIFFNTKHFI